MYELDQYLRLKDLRHRFDARIDYFHEVSSTNDVLRDPEYWEGDAVIAGAQTKGRGQRGNSWESERGKNLTFSTVYEPRFLPAAQQFLLSEAVSLAVVDMLQSFGIGAAVKWPNDIYVGDRKIAGILIENDIMGPTLSRSIVGIGLNVNQVSFDPELANPTSMALETGVDFDLSEVFEKLYYQLEERYYEHLSEQFIAGDTVGLQADYHSKLYLLDTLHSFRLPDGTTIEGSIRRVEPMGELVVEHRDGTLHEYLFKEIEFRAL